MYTHTNYSKRTLDELISEEAKIKKQTTFLSAMVGVATGMLLYALVFYSIGFKHSALLMLIALLAAGAHKRGQDLKAIKTEISSRN